MQFLFPHLIGRTVINILAIPFTEYFLESLTDIFESWIFLKLLLRHVFNFLHYLIKPLFKRRLWTLQLVELCGDFKHVFRNSELEVRICLVKIVVIVPNVEGVFSQAFVGFRRAIGKLKPAFVAVPIALSVAASVPSQNNDFFTFVVKPRIPEPSEVFSFQPENR